MWIQNRMYAGIIQWERDIIFSIALDLFIYLKMVDNIWQLQTLYRIELCYDEKIMS